MKTRFRWLKTALLAGGGLIVVVLLVAWMSGMFTAKTPPGRTEPDLRTVPADAVVPVELRQVPQITRAIGTIRAVHETDVGSRLLARVKKVNVIAGQPVDEGEVLIELERADIEARIEQAKANVNAAKATLDQTRSDLEKVEQLHANASATERELTDARRAVQVAEANLAAAQQGLEEARSQLDYATIRSPITGVVIDKQIEEGDLAQPGRTLVTLYDPKRLQLVAAVPERLAVNLEVDQQVEVEVDAIDMRCHATISEIVQQADPVSRSLLVKVTGPCPPNVYSGMFGRLLLKEGERTQLLIPASAVKRIGQLEMVQVVTGADGTDPAKLHVESRLVRTGARQGEKIEVLAGLNADERVVAQPVTRQPG